MINDAFVPHLDVNINRPSSSSRSYFSKNSPPLRLDATILSFGSDISAFQDVVRSLLPLFDPSKTE